MDISGLSVTELKALAYDEQVKMELARNNLIVLAQEIQKRQTPPIPVGTPSKIKEGKKDEPKAV